MSYSKLLALPKRGLRFVKRNAGKIIARFNPPGRHLVFLFSNRTKYWTGIGKDLYEQEPVFRNIIRECDVIIRKISNTSILPNFEGTATDSFFEDEANVGFTITAIQMALSELYKSKGVIPDYITGISIGEVAAVYALGGLSMEEGLKIIYCYKKLSEVEKKEYVSLFAFADIETINALCHKSEFWVAPLIYCSAQTVLLYCHINDLKGVTAFFSAHQIHCKKPDGELYWPSHTCLVEPHKLLIQKFTGDIDPKSINSDYYSPTYGKVIPKHSIIPADYWYDMMRKPILFDKVIDLLKPLKNLVLLNAGPHFFLKAQVQHSLGPGLVYFDSMHHNNSALQIFKSVYQSLKGLGLNKRKPGTLAPADEYRRYVNNLDFNIPELLNNPYDSYAYLSKHGPVHYLPVENAWMVLDHELINTILKQPELYSSKVHQGFDSILLGADPPSHTLVRTMLQPLFSPQSFEQLGQYAYTRAASLLNELLLQQQFDIVPDFALPLAQDVVAHFLGLSDEETAYVHARVSSAGHRYTLAYLPQLEGFFEEYLTKKQQEPDAGIGSLILTFVKDGHLTFEGAVSLMKMLWVAGMTTTSMLISQTANALIQNPEIRQQLMSDEGNINKFVDECLRLEAPESELRRITTQEVVLNNVKIPAGALLILSIRAANRQKDIFPQPNEILLSRSGKRHLSFGGGYHYCLGIGMARAEVKNAVKALLNAAPYLKISSPGRYFPSFHFRAFESLSVSVISDKESNANKYEGI